MRHFFGILLRSGFAVCLPLLLLLAIGTPASADDSWVGKKIITKKAGIRTGYSDENNKERIVATLNQFDYVVIAEEGGFIQVRENGAEGWFEKADAVLLEDAIAYFTAHIRRNERDADAYARRGAAWLLKGEYDSALKDYNEAIRLQPDEPAWFTHRGNLWLAKKDYDEAIKDYSQAIKLDPKSVVAFNGRGMAYYYQMDYERAIENYSQAIRFDPKNATAYLNRGYAYDDKMDYERAIDDYGEAIRLDPESSDAYGNRAVTRPKIKQYAHAVLDFQKAMRLAPSTAWLHRDYALFRASCPEEKYRAGPYAVELAGRAIELAGPDADWEYHATLAAAYAEAGQFDKSIAEQTKALEDKSLDGEDRAKMEQRLKLYRKKKPYWDEE